MQRLFGVFLLSGIVSCSFSASAEDAGSGVAIRIYNYAGVHSSILGAAQRQATAILNEAGSGAGWIECPVSPEQPRGMPGCAKPLAGVDVVLNLLPEAMSRRAGQPAGTFGFSVPTSPQGLGTVSVFVNKTDDLAFYGPFSVGYEVARAVVLGHVIAHEIGHLLLGPGSHSTAGLMSSRWSEKEIKQLATRHLCFSTKEASIIRKRLDHGQVEGALSSAAR